MHQGLSEGIQVARSEPIHPPTPASKLEEVGVDRDLLEAALDPLVDEGGAPPGESAAEEQQAKRRGEQKLIQSLQIKLRTAEGQIATLEDQQTQILAKYKTFQGVYQKQKNQLVETLQDRHTLEESQRLMGDRTNELQKELETVNQLHSNLQLRFKQKSDEHDIAKSEYRALTDKLSSRQSVEKKSEESLQKVHEGALLRIEELEAELEQQRASQEETSTRAKQKEGQLEQRMEEYSQSLVQAQQEAQQLS